MSRLSVTRETGITLVGIARPDKHNALDRETVSEIEHALVTAARSPGVIVFHSTTPGIFVSGADIGELRDRGADDALSRINGALFDRIAVHRWPTIAAIDGPALGGGCELSLACDFRIATASATFGQPEARLGILAGAGANWRLERVVGVTIARQMLLAGRTLSADEALASGLVDEITTSDELLARARAFGAQIAQSSWRALELTKLALQAAHPQTTASFDAVAQALLFESDEKRRRMDDYLDRHTAAARRER